MKTNSKKSIVAVAVVIIVVVAGIVIWKMNSKQDRLPDMTPIASENSETPSVQNENPAPKALTVLLTDEGFSPETMIITAGDTIIFINQSSGKMHVASDPHPFHTTYPEFNQKQSVDAGGTYSFTFTKVGTWGFHNHLNPSAQGTIVVQTIPSKG